MNTRELILLFLLSSAMVFLTVFYVQHLKPYQSGLNFLKENNYFSARQEFLHLLEQKPFLFSARLNLAFTESLQKNIKSAIGEYQVTAEGSPNKKERFQAQFNSALLKFLSGDISSSLEHYQKALKEYAESIPVKANIEWMMRLQNQQNKQQKNPENQKEKQKEDQNKEKENNKNSKQGAEQKLQETKQGEKNEEKKLMNEDQVQFIFKELEEREKKLRSRLQNQKGKKKKGKSW